MGSINRLTNGTLYLDFRCMGRRCKEYTKLKDTPENRKRLEKILARIESEAVLGTLGQNYANYFPNSKRVTQFSSDIERVNVAKSGLPSFGDFADTWFDQMKIEWRESHTDTVRATLDLHILPAFGDRSLTAITKDDLLNFRSDIAKRPGRGGNTLSNERVNHIMTPLRMILNEAAERFNFETPYKGIKSLSVPKTDVQPFTLAEVQLIINSVRKDLRNYFCVRFYCALRTSEIDGLQWKYVNFDRREIHVCETLVNGELGETKTPGSNRIIQMSQVVYEALRGQQEETGTEQFVFCSSRGAPINHNNLTKRVWYPLLDRLGLERRRPYQTRHTAATLWLAAGENPEWIARQMGHTSTEMLFRVYSRYVPNLTRQDGSAFEALLKQTQTAYQALNEGD